MGICNLGRQNHRHAHAIRCGEMERGLCHTHGSSVVVEHGERGRLWKRFHGYSSRGSTDTAALPSGCGPRGLTMTNLTCMSFHLNYPAGWFVRSVSSNNYSCQPHT